MLTPEQHAKREGHVTASFAPDLMAGNNEKIRNKWLELIGDPGWVPEDLSNEWAPSWGAYGEPFILNWHQRKTGYPIERRGEFVQHPTLAHVGCTLDGHRAFDDTAIDAKVCHAHQSIDEIIALYAPQVIVQKACLQCMHGALLIVHGNAEPREYAIEPMPEYEGRVWARIAEFWHCVQNFIEPTPMLPKIVPPDQWRTIDLSLDDEFNWAGDMKAALALWASNKDGADAFNTATKDVKKLLPDDVGTLLWGGLLVKRNRANAVSIKRK